MASKKGGASFLKSGHDEDFMVYSKAMNIAVLISGGVDSSVALHKLVAQGHNVTAFYLKIWLEDELSYLGTCPWEEDLAYVQAVCEKLAVPLEVVSLQKEYWDRVVAYTIDEVKKGRTPNPDIMCNQQVKFGAFYEKYGHAFDAIATGHYADTKRVDGVTYLLQSPDAIKDQTYFLSRLSQEQLSKALFPLGPYTKQQVRAYAEMADLPNKARKDSQGICFLGTIKFSDFIEHHVGTKPGKLIEYETGKGVGSHKGAWFYTIGQRQGLGLAGGPWYVVKKDHGENTVFISKEYYAPDKRRDSVMVEDFRWLSGPLEGNDFLVKLRHGPAMVQGKVQEMPDRVRITLERSDQGIAAGQYAVLYRDNVCVASGVMTGEE